MKICLYCDSVNDDSAKVCSTCGASQFKNKCNNCGTVFESSYCPTCGTKAGAQAKICPQCGERYFTPACPKCGHNDILNKAQQSAEEAPQRIVVEHITRAEERPKKKVTFGRVLLWIFFLPIMAIIATWRSKKLTMIWKLILTTIIVVLAFIFYGFRNDEESTSVTKNNSSQYTVRAQTANGIAEAPKATIQATDEPKQARNGIKEGTRKYTIRDFNISIPYYFGEPAQTTKENTLQFLNPAEKDIALFVFLEDSRIQKTEFDAKVEQAFLNIFQNAKLTESEEVKVASLPGRRFDATGYYKNVHVNASGVFALDESQQALFYVILLQGDNAQYDYSADFSRMVMTVSRKALRHKTETAQSNSGTVSEDLKAMLDEYEAFVDSYCDFMKKYSETSDVSGLAMEYMNILSKYSSWAQKMDDLNEEDLSGADLLYYEEVMLRCSNKMLKVVGN